MGCQEDHFWDGEKPRSRKRRDQGGLGSLVTSAGKQIEKIMKAAVGCRQVAGQYTCLAVPCSWSPRSVPSS